MGREGLEILQKETVKGIYTAEKMIFLDTFLLLNKKKEEKMWIQAVESLCAVPFSLISANCILA